MKVIALFAAAVLAVAASSAYAGGEECKACCKGKCSECAKCKDGKCAECCKK
jgi:hypothetical protein